MKKTISELKNVTRRETIAMLASAGIFSLPGIKIFQSDIDSNINKLAGKMKDSINRNSTLQTIGILGGVGPQATMDLEMRIHNVAQQLLPAAQNTGYPPMVVQYYRHAPVLLTQTHQPLIPLQLDPRLLEVAKRLGSMADFLLLPSNGLHMFQKEIEHVSGRKIISMIDATLEEVRTRGWKKAGVLGLMNPIVYTTRLKNLGIAFETIDVALQEKLNQSIFKVMEGRENDVDATIALEAIRQLRNKNVDGIIPGCTEIPFLLGPNMDAKDLLNPAQLLAEAAVRYSIG